MLVRKPITWLGLILTVLAPASARAIEVRDAIDRFLRAETIKREWFAPSFLNAVPFEQLPMLRQQLTGPLGAFEAVRPDGDHYVGVYEKATVPVYASLDADGRFVGLRLMPPVARIADAAELTSRFEALPGDGTLLVVVDGQERIAIEADTPFAVGSAFKLFVLRALVDQIERGERRWSDVVELGPEHRTVATGTLSGWPDGMPLTLASLAARMISESDNTATDVVMHTVGREAVEADDPSRRNRPFLTTAEFFRLKNPANADLLARWREGDEAARRALLDELARRPLPDPALFAGDPVATDVEWFFTARELCAAIAAVGELDLMGINPGVISRSGHDRVAYKGGSEPGVLNLTTWTRDANGATACVCVTRNADQTLELGDVSGIAAAAFDLFASGEED